MLAVIFDNQLLQVEAFPDALPDTDPSGALARTILLNGTVSAIVPLADQIQIRKAVPLPPGGFDVRNILTLDTNGFARLRHYDRSAAPGAEDVEGTSFKLPGTFITTDAGVETFFLSHDVSTINVITTDAANGRIGLMITGRPANGPTAQPHTTADILVQWSFTLQAPLDESSTLTIDTFATFQQPVSFSQTRINEAQAFRAFEYSSSYVPDANTAPQFPTTHDADELRVTDSRSRELSKLDVGSAAAFPDNTLIYPGGLVFDGWLELNQIMPSPLNTDPPNNRADILPAADNPEYRAQAFKTVNGTINQDSDNLSAWISRTLPSSGPVTTIAANTMFQWTVKVAAADDTLIRQDLRVAARGVGAAPQVRVFDGLPPTAIFDFNAYDPIFPGGVRVAAGDVSGDGIPDVITVPGPGGAPQVRVFDGLTGMQLPLPVGSFLPYAASFLGGVYVATGDVNGDTFSDIITGADFSGGQHVQAFSGRDGSLLRNFMAYGAGFTGGVRVAAGDVDADGRADIITGAGPGGGPHVQVFRGTDLAVLHSFFAFDAGFTGGVWVEAARIDADTRSEIIVGAGAGGGPHVRVFSGLNLTVLHSFFAYGDSFTGGVRVAAADLNGDGRDDIITGAGPGGGPHVREFNGITLAELDSFFAFEDSFTGGVFVAGRRRS